MFERTGCSCSREIFEVRPRQAVSSVSPETLPVSNGVDWVNVHRLLKEEVESFIFLTGDGDFEPLYKMLAELKKQVIVVYTRGHLGREIWDIKKGIFKVELKNLVEL